MSRRGKSRWPEAWSARPKKINPHVDPPRLRELCLRLIAELPWPGRANAPLWRRMAARLFRSFRQKPWPGALTARPPPAPD